MLLCNILDNKCCSKALIKQVCFIKMSLAHRTKHSLSLYCLNLYYCHFLGTMGFYAPNSCIHHVYLEGIHCSGKICSTKILVKCKSTLWMLELFFSFLSSCFGQHASHIHRHCHADLQVLNSNFSWAVYFSKQPPLKIFLLHSNMLHAYLFYSLWSYHFSICCYFGLSLGHFPNIVHSYVSIIVTAQPQAMPTQDKTRKKNANQSKHYVGKCQQLNYAKSFVFWR